MARIVWSQQGQNRYEYGVDRGVLYFPTTTDRYGRGIVWNGLVNVEESNVGGDVSSYHFDGVKYLDITNPKNYQATISAYDVPYDFMHLVGDYPVIPGIVLTRQARVRFGLCYRTFIGGSSGYKLHLIYHVLARKQKHSWATQQKNITAPVSSWTMSAVPASAPGFRPSAHFILDSTVMNPDILATLESMLYGSTKHDARLPTIEEVTTLVWKWEPVIIMPDTLNGLAGLVKGVGDLYRTVDDGLNRALPEGRLVESDFEGLYNLQEE